MNSKHSNSNSNSHPRDIREVLADTTNAYTIGICGGTSSGKTWVVEVLKKMFGDYLMTIPQDAFYKTATADTNFDHPNSIDFGLLINCAERAKAGEDIDIPTYDFVTHSRTDNTLHLKAKPIVIVEGILIMTSPELEKLCDLTIYVHAELDIMYRRRSRRDQVERGRTQESIDTQWDTFVKPMHIQYVLPTKARANITINNDRQQILTKPLQIPQIRMIVTYIETHLSQLSEIGSMSSDD